MSSRSVVVALALTLGVRDAEVVLERAEKTMIPGGSATSGEAKASQRVGSLGWSL